MKDQRTFFLGAIFDVEGAVERSDYDERLRAVELHLQRRTQRAGRNDTAIADAAAAINHHDGEIFDERRILHAVVHDGDARAGILRELRAGRAVTRHDGWGHSRPHKTLGPAL